MGERPMASRSEREAPKRRLLLTGATGYVGRRLLRTLENRGHRVRCLARKPEHLASRVSSHMQVVAGGVVSGEGLDEAMAGIETAYYLVHSMGSAGAFEEELSSPGARLPGDAPGHCAGGPGRHLDRRSGS
jgi:hypothetical protein